jgi:hypothetical protein
LEYLVDVAKRDHHVVLQTPLPQVTRQIAES